MVSGRMMLPELQESPPATVQRQDQMGLGRDWRVLEK
jgi:hypothetical protein